MGLESMHARSLMERPHHPDHPQLVRWTGRRAEPWTPATAETDEQARNPWKALRKNAIRKPTGCKLCDQKEWSA